jgi:hypothetical protein
MSNQESKRERDASTRRKQKNMERNVLQIVKVFSALGNKRQLEVATQIDDDRPVVVAPKS